MEINITKFFNDACFMDYSASISEIGNNAGKDTWNAACEDADDYNLLVTEEEKEAFKGHVKAFGAWSAEEIAAWSDTELNALFIQLISGDRQKVACIAASPVCTLKFSTVYVKPFILTYITIIPCTQPADVL